MIWREVEREPSLQISPAAGFPSSPTAKSFFWIFLNLLGAAGRNCGGKTCKRYDLASLYLSLPRISHIHICLHLTFRDSLKCSSCTFFILCFPASVSGKQMLAHFFFLFFQVIVFLQTSGCLPCDFCSLVGLRGLANLNYVQLLPCMGEKDTYAWLYNSVLNLSLPNLFWLKSFLSLLNLSHFAFNLFVSLY